jgi:hypothetical protein
MWGALSDERMGLPFTITAGPRQRSHSWVRVPRDSWPYFTLSDSRLPHPGGPGPRIYIPQEQGSTVIPPGTGFHFRRLLRLTGLRWRYSKPPPRGLLSRFSFSFYDWTTYIVSRRIRRKQIRCPVRDIWEPHKNTLPLLLYLQRVA